MWQPMGRFRMVDLESEVFLAIFEDSSDYFHALTGGPWIILDHYLAVFTWDPQFRVSVDLSQKMVVWIRFPRLPYQYYHSDVLSGLGDLIGKTVRFDSRTKSSVRGKFARIAVEIDLTNPPPKGVFVDGMWQVVEYENLPSFCRECGRFGHDLENCDHRRPTTISGPSPPSSTSALVESLGLNTTPVEPKGPWQTVERRCRRSKKESSGQLNGSTKFEGSIKGKFDSPPSNGSSKSVSEINGAGVGKFDSRPKNFKARQDPLTKPVVEASNSGLSWKAKSGVPTGGTVTQLMNMNKFGPNSRPTLPKHVQLTPSPLASGPDPMSVRSGKSAMAAASLSSIPTSPPPSIVSSSACSDDPVLVDVSMTDQISGVQHTISTPQLPQLSSPIPSVMVAPSPNSAVQSPQKLRSMPRTRKPLASRSICGKPTWRVKPYSPSRTKLRDQMLVGSIQSMRGSLPKVKMQGLPISECNLGLAVDSTANNCPTLVSTVVWEDNTDDEAVDADSTCSDAVLQQTKKDFSSVV
ncbi:hypothetical protein LINGRAHAP2_LOCUS6578 [Linum grandiflorum]